MNMKKILTILCVAVAASLAYNLGKSVFVTVNILTGTLETFFFMGIALFVPFFLSKKKKDAKNKNDFVKE